MYLSLELDKAAGCEQNVFEIRLDVSEIYFKCNLNVFINRPRQGLGVKNVRLKNI